MGKQTIERIVSMLVEDDRGNSAHSSEYESECENGSENDDEHEHEHEEIASVADAWPVI